MVCSICNGRVEWQGKLSNLTHTKCLDCGALNSQIPEKEDDEDDSLDFLDGLNDCFNERENDLEDNVTHGVGYDLDEDDYY